MVAGRGQPFDLETKSTIAIGVLGLEAGDLADNTEDEETLPKAVVPTAVIPTMVAQPAPAQPPPTQPVGRWWLQPLFLTWMMYNFLGIMVFLLTISTHPSFIRPRWWTTAESSMGQENTRDWLWQNKQIKIQLWGLVNRRPL